jgi:PKD repeat protein
VRARLAPLALATLTAVTLTLGALTGSTPATPTAPSTLLAAATPGEVHFTAAGDYGAGANSRAVLGLIGTIAPDLNLALGDLSYGVTGTEQEWCDLVTGYVGAGFPFELLAGNHESDGLNGNINDFSACLPNQLPGLVGTYGRQWYVDVPAQDPLVRYVMISPAITFPEGATSYAAGSARYQWTAAAIDGARAASIPWVVVGMHKPCLSIGNYACDPGADITNLLLSKKVDLVLNGHEHLYQRTKQLALRTGCTALVPGTYDADCVADSDASLVKGAGTVFATVGTGGVAQRDLNPADPDAPYFAASSGLATATWGVLDVRATATTLTAGFVRASGGTFADAFTIGAGGPVENVAPTAGLTASCTGLDCAFDASSSTDPDGTIASYAWDFGDGTAPVVTPGPTTTHRFAAAGTFTAHVTVTDDDATTGTATRDVSPTVGAAPFALDTFTRTVTSGLGTAETGGAWRVTGSTSGYAVNGGVGRVTMAAAGAGPDLSLPAVASSSTDLSLALSADKPMTGGGLYASVVGRRVAGVGDYRAKIQLRSTGAVVLSLVRTAGSTETAIAPAAVLPGVTSAPGQRLLVRLQVTGTSPTTVQARVWAAGTPEPTTWAATRTDSTAGLQVPGAVALNLYLSSSTTNAPHVFQLDDLVARTP